MSVALSGGLVRTGAISGEVVTGHDRAATQGYERPYPTIVRPALAPGIRLVSKLEVEQAARVSRAEAKAYTWRNFAVFGAVGWVVALALIIYLFAPRAFPWIVSHGYFMSLLGVGAVCVVFAYRIAEVVREPRHNAPVRAVYP